MYMVDQGPYFSLRDPIDNIPVFQNSRDKQLKFKVVQQEFVLLPPDSWNKTSSMGGSNSEEVFTDLEVGSSRVPGGPAS